MAAILGQFSIIFISLINSWLHKDKLVTVEIKNNVVGTQEVTPKNQIIR